jgi:hypothetical protein
MCFSALAFKQSAGCGWLAGELRLGVRLLFGLLMSFHPYLPVLTLSAQPTTTSAVFQRIIYREKFAWVV